MQLLVLLVSNIDIIMNITSSYHFETTAYINFLNFEHWLEFVGKASGFTTPLLFINIGD